jgi:hypothetical protein
MTLEGVCAAMETAHASKVDLGGDTIKANAAGARQKSKLKLVCENQTPEMTQEEMVSRWRWGEGLTPVACWTVSKGSGTICN